MNIKKYRKSIKAIMVLIISIFAFIIIEIIIQNIKYYQNQPLKNNIPQTGFAQKSPSIKKNVLSPEQIEERNKLIEQPLDQKRFIAVIAESRRAYNSLLDEFNQGTIRPARRKAICELGYDKERRIKDWVVTINSRKTDREGRGILVVNLDNNTILTTRDPSISEVRDKSIILPDSVIYDQMRHLKTGDYIKITGLFTESKIDCIKENSYNLQNSIVTPRFTFLFEHIEKIELPKE